MKDEQFDAFKQLITASISAAETRIKGSITRAKDEQFEDLKQYIDSRISQSETRLEQKIENVEIKLDAQISTLRTEMFDGFAGVGEAVEEINIKLDKHDKLLVRRPVGKPLPKS